jgi:hypothetical protein
LAVILPPAVKSPVLGLNVNLVDDVFNVDKEPLVADVKLTYLVALVDVSSVIVIELPVP